MEMKKTVIVCFVGTAIGTAVALAVAPLFWWLGLLAGFGAGYFCCDLKEVWEKAPIAWEKTKKRSTFPLAWLKKIHPFFWPFLLVFALSALFGLNFVLKSKDVMLLLLFPLAVGIYFAFLFHRILFFLAEIGSIKHKFGENCYWSEDVFGKKQGQGNTYVEPTYQNIYRLMLRGLWICIYFVLWEMWILAPKFLKNLFILIRSHKRVVYGIDCAIGVTLTYILLGSKAVTPGQQAMVVICGGIIGAAIGVLDYEIVSKRLLHLVPATNNT